MQCYKETWSHMYMIRLHKNNTKQRTWEIRRLRQIQHSTIGKTSDQKVKTRKSTSEIGIADFIKKTSLNGAGVK